MPPANSNIPATGRDTEFTKRMEMAHETKRLIAPSLTHSIGFVWCFLQFILCDCQRANCLTVQQSVASGVTDSVRMQNIFCKHFREDFSITTTTDDNGLRFY